MEAWPSASANPNRPPCGAMPALGKLTRRTPSIADSMRSWSGPSSIATWSGSAASTTPRSWAGRRLRRGSISAAFWWATSRGSTPSAARTNIAKRLLVHAAAFHLSLILRQVLGVGTARQAADLLAALCFCVLRLMDTANRRPLVVGTPWPKARRARRVAIINRRAATTWLYPRAAKSRQLAYPKTRRLSRMGWFEAYARPAGPLCSAGGTRVRPRPSPPGRRNLAPGRAAR
jgi:hypothetical protein